MQVINLPTNFSYTHKLLRLLGICFVIFAAQMAKAQDKYERFSDKGKYGINKNGKKHVKAKYGDMKLEDKSELVLIRDYNKSKWGVMDKTSGKEIAPLRYDEINFHRYGKEPFSKDLIAPYYIAKIDNKFGVIDQKGKDVIPVMYENIYVLDNEKPYF